MKTKLNDITSISVGTDGYGNLTTISSQISFGGMTLKGSVSKGTFSGEISLKRGNNFNWVKASYTPGSEPSDLPRLKPLPLLPIPRPILIP